MNKIAIGATAIGATAIIGLTTGLIVSIIKNKQKNKIINNLKDQVLDCKCEIIAIKETERQCKMLDKMNDSKKLVSVNFDNLLCNSSMVVNLWMYVEMSAKSSGLN